MLTLIMSPLAGLLSTLSPCVLPVLPMIVGGALQKHRKAPLAMAAGLVVSFTVLGMFLSTVGDWVGVSAEAMRAVSASFLVLFGATLMLPRLQSILQKIVRPISNAANSRLGNGNIEGLWGYFGLGALLGAVWSPCIGPTLGAALSMSSQSGGLGKATLVMFLFGVGAVVPLLLIAYGSRKLVNDNRHKLLKSSQVLKPLFGVVLLFLGVSILTGVDKLIETSVLNILPNAWLDLLAWV